MKSRSVIQLALISSLASVSAMATQAADEVNRPAQIQYYTLNIASGNAEQVLEHFLESVDILLIYAMDDVEGVVLNAVQGTMTAETALNRLVENTTLTTSRDISSGAWLLKSRVDELRGVTSAVEGSVTIENPEKNNPMKIENKPGNTLISRMMRGLSSLIIAGAVGTASAQTDSEEEIYILDPFVVDTDAESSRYLGTETLGGSRLRTDIRDLATAISLISEAFLDDVAATNSEDLLIYTLGTEVGGARGNFSGLDPGGEEVGSGALLQPEANTRVRGLATADNTRGFFPTDIPWDSYNVDRIEIQRGPNSILFGVGSPAGIINSNPVPAAFDDEFEFTLRTDEYGTVRGELDINRVILEDVLAIRLAALHEDKKYMQENAFEDDQRHYVAITFRPQWLGSNNPTTFRANYEKGNIDASRPRFTPPEDRITPFFATGSNTDGLNRQVFDPMYAGAYNIRYLENLNPNLIPDNAEPWLGRISNFRNGSPLFIFDNGTSAPRTVRQSRPVTLRGFDEFGALNGPNANGVFGGNILGLPDGEQHRGLAPTGFNEFTKKANQKNPALFPGADKNFYLNRHLTDPSIYNFYKYSLDGPIKQEFQDWEAYNLALSQSFLSGRFGFELVFDYQDYSDERVGRVRPEIGIDVGTHISLASTRYFPADYVVPDDGNIPIPDPTSVSGGILNSEVGRAYVIMEPLNDGNYRNIERENFRATAYIELRASDLFKEDSFLERLLNRQVFTGLFNNDERKTFTRAYDSYKTDLGWVSLLGANGDVGTGERIPATMIYLSDSLLSRNSASGLNLMPVMGDVVPSGAYTTTYFDSTWNAGPDVGFGDLYIDPLLGTESTQSENPDNYIGLTTTEVNILNARDGDIDQLTRTATRSVETIESKAFIYQGYFWDGKVVGTYGWREDTSEVYSGSGPSDPFTNVQSADFVLEKPDAVNTDAPDDIERVTGETISWGVVAHITDIINVDLPLGTRFSVFYNESENFSPSIRFGFDTNPIPNQAGLTEEIGFIISTLDDRLTLRINKYETEVTDQDYGANINQFAFRRTPAWVTTAAIRHEAYWAGYPTANYMGFSDVGWAQSTGSERNAIIQEFGGVPASNLNARAFTQTLPANQEIIEGINAWYDFLRDNQEFMQTWFDQLSFDVDLDAVVNGTIEDRVERTFLGEGADGSIVNTFDVLRRGPGSIQSRTRGRIQGKFPTATANTLSEGWELEAAAQLTDSWNIAFNATKTDATITQINEGFENFMNLIGDALQGPAGRIPRQGGGRVRVGDEFNNRVFEPFLFALEQIGTRNPETREWRVNFITNYRFREGKLRGLNIGGGYRWQDDIIIGYGITEVEPGNWRRDVNKPIFGASEGNVDLWAGYRRKLTDKIDWNVRLNIRNVGQDDRLIPISADPDGTATRFRIAEGMTWTLTNTFSF